jgi:hypothetical protein
MGVPPPPSQLCVRRSSAAAALSSRHPRPVSARAAPGIGQLGREPEPSPRHAGRTAATPARAAAAAAAQPQGE